MLYIKRNKETLFLTMEKIGIVTSARELNYGALLQAYALQCVLCAKGFDARLLWWANQKVSRRDVRLRKLFAIAWKFICNPSIIRKSISSVLVSSFFSPQRQADFTLTMTQPDSSCRVAQLFLLWVAHLIRCHQVLHVRIAHPFLSQGFIAQIEKIFQHQATDHQTDGDGMFTLRGVQRSKLLFKIQPVYLV